MKCLYLAVILVTGCSFVLAQDFQILLQAHAQCEGITGIAPSQVTGIMTGNFPNDPVLKRHLLCIHQRLGVQDANGNIQSAALMQLADRMLPRSIPRDRVQQIINNCAVQRGTPEDTALEMDRCLFQSGSAFMG